MEKGVERNGARDGERKKQRRESTEIEEPREKESKCNINVANLQNNIVNSATVMQNYSKKYTGIS